MRRVKPKAGSPPNPVCRVTKNKRRQIDHLAALNALRVQVPTHPAVHLRQVIGRQAAIEVHVAQHANVGQAFKRAVHRRPVSSAVENGDPLQELVGRQMLGARFEDAGQDGDPRLGHAQPDRPQQLHGAFLERKAG